MLILGLIFVFLCFISALLYQISPAITFALLFIGMSWLIVLAYAIMDGDGKR
jgi:hypothetical protein